MKPSRRKLFRVLVVFMLVGGFAALIFTAPKHAVAVFRVVDGTGKPIQGAVIVPEGMRTKPGPYQSGWYSWLPERNGVPNPAVRTDRDGVARVPYPKYVFEHIETGVLCLTVEHAEYVPDRPERRVAAAPPRGAPWSEWLKWVGYMGSAIMHKQRISETDPIVLQKGAVVEIRLKLPNGDVPHSGRSSAQVSVNRIPGTNFWTQLEPGLILCRQLGTNAQTLRAVHLAEDGITFFSDLISVTPLLGITNVAEAKLSPGVAVRGQVDQRVPRPVRNGNVIANIWPAGCSPQSNPPQWHSFGEIRSEGSFEIPFLPPGDLELVAICDGFVSSNGPGQTSMRYPQKFVLGTNDLSVVIGMEPTVRLEVTVTDPQGRPVKDATVLTWPNVRYGEWSATILGGDCYVTSDWLFKAPPTALLLWKIPPGFKGVSDSNGVAVLSNLPLNVNTLSVEHSKYELPPVKNQMGGQDRQVLFALAAGKTNSLRVQLVPIGKSMIKHY